MRFMNTRPMRSLSALTLAAAVAGLSAPAEAAPARAKIDNDNNVVTHTNKPLRGAPWFMDTFGYDHFNNNRSTYENYFATVRDYGINTVRIAPYMFSYDVNFQAADGFGAEVRRKYTDYILTCVKWAAKYDIYAVINLHTQQSNKWDKGNIRAFWETILDPSQNADNMNYANQSHVIFELFNEPDWKDPDGNSRLGDYQEIYNLVRDAAPDSMILIGSHVGAKRQNFAPSNLASLSVDWSKSAYAYHVYEGPGASDGSGDRIDPKQWEAGDDFRDSYPTIVTELYSLTNANDFPIDWRTLRITVSQGEARDWSWMCWAPRVNYANLNGDGSGTTHDESKFDDQFTDELAKEGVDLSDTAGGVGGDDGGGDNPYAGDRRVRDQWKGYVLQPSGTSNNNWVLMKIQEGITQQKWQIERVGTTGNTYRFKNPWSGKYLTVPSRDTDYGVVQIHGLRDNWSSQKFAIEDAGNGRKYVRCQWNSRYLVSRGDAGGTLRNAALTDTNRGWGSIQWKFPAF